MPSSGSSRPIKLPGQFDRQLTEIAKQRHTTRAKALRDALAAFAKDASPTAGKEPAKPTVESVVGDLIGSLEGPGGLLSNLKHMAGYGR